MLRHPAFQGLREDKSAAEVVYDRMTGDVPHPADPDGPAALSRAAGERQKGRAVPNPLSRNAGEGQKGRAAPKPLTRNAGEGAGVRRAPAGEGASVDSARARDGSISFAGVRLTN